MKNKIQNGIPAFLAISVLLAAEIIKISEVVPERQQNNFEIMSNVVMLIVAAVGFLLWGLPSLSGSSCSVGKIFSNIVVSVMAFVMNIDVFESAIRHNYLLEDLWGWHTCWIICILLQILFLTGLGRVICGQIRILINIINNMIKVLENLFSILLDAMKRNQFQILFVVIGFLFWGVFFGTLCRSKSPADIFSDISFWKSSALLWIFYFMVAFLLYIVPSVFQRVKATIQNTSGKVILMGTLLFFFAILTNVLPSLLQALAVVISIPATLTGSLWIVVKKVHSSGTDIENKYVKPEYNKPKYVLIILLYFVGIPLTLLFFVTFLWAGGSDIIEQDPTNITSWLDFLGTVAEVAKALLNLFR